MAATYEEVFENNKKWVSAQLDKDANFFDKLAADQTPDYLYIGCADSRVPANEIMGLEPGDVITYTIVVANGGPGVATGVTITAENVSVLPKQYGADSAGRRYDERVVRVRAVAPVAIPHGFTC